MKMKFIEDLRKELSKTNLSAVEMEEIMNDYEEMVRSALEEGLKESDLESKFGSPENIVKELGNFSEESDSSNEKSEKVENNYDGNEFKFSPENNYNVIIELTNEDINIEVWDRPEIVILPVRIKKIKDYDIEFKNNTLVLKKNPTTIFSIFGRIDSGEFLVKLPKNIELNDIKFSNVNGDGSLKGLNCSQMNFKTTNGDFSLNDCQIKNLAVHSTNGDLELSNIVSEKLKISVVSGDIEIDTTNVNGDFDYNSVSGDIDVSNLDAKNVYLKLVSGDFSGKQISAENFTVRTVNGDVKIDNTNSDKTINHISKSSVSGTIEINQ